MTERKSKFSIIGMGIGAIALLLALTHFWGGPFSPQPTLETTIAEKVSSIRSATLDAIKGKAVEKKSYISNWDADKITSVTTAVLGGLAVIFGLFGFTKKESTRVAGAAAALGVSAISFQFIAMYAMALLVVILIASILSAFSFG